MGTLLCYLLGEVHKPSSCTDWTAFGEFFGNALILLRISVFQSVKAC